jgi:signal transduction histidine kinase
MNPGATPTPLRFSAVMPIEQLFVIGLPPERHALLAEAVSHVWPKARVTACERGSEREERSASAQAMMVLFEPAPSAAQDLARALDASGLPRWPVLVVAAERPYPGAEWIAPDEWRVPALARALAGAAEKHALRRENARLKGDLLTMARRVNHDLRSSLNGVVTAGEVIREVLLADQPGDLALVQPVTESAAEIARLIDQVSFIAKATAGEAVPQPLPMDELLWRGLARVERRIRELNAEVRHADAWPVVPCVGPWIEMVWASLLSNALEHSGPRPLVAPGWREEDHGWRFWVEDRGPGVPPEKRAALFTPFHRLSENDAPKGFGLAVVQRLMELQGGTQGYEEREGGGARFYFTLRKMPAR